MRCKDCSRTIKRPTIETKKVRLCGKCRLKENISKNIHSNRISI